MSLIKLHTEKNEVIGGTNKNSPVTRENLVLLGSTLENLVIRNMVLINPIVKLTHVKNVLFDNVEIVGGFGDISSGPILLENMENLDKWAGVGNYTGAVGDDRDGPGNPNPLHYRRNWLQGRFQEITITKNRVFLTPNEYFTNLWLLRDSTGKDYPGKLEKFAEGKETITFHVSTQEPMAAGWGFFHTLKPSRFSENITFRNCRFTKHKFFSLYYTRGIRVVNSVFGESTNDYPWGIETCDDVEIIDSVFYGVSKWSTIGMLGGNSNVVIRNTISTNTSAISRNWPMRNIKSDVPIFFDDLETGWYSNVKCPNVVIDKQGGHTELNGTRN